MGVSQKWADSRRTLWLNSVSKKKKKEIEQIENEFFNGDYSREEEYKRLIKFTDKQTQLNLDELKARVKIADIIGTTPIKRDQRIDWYKCVSHNDTNPSMAVYRDQNRAYCYACNFSGSVLDIYMKVHRCDITEAVRELNKL